MGSAVVQIERSLAFARGQVAKARDLSIRQIDALDAVKDKDARGSLQADLASNELVLGYEAQAQKDLLAALATAPDSTNTLSNAVISLGYIGDLQRQQPLMDELSKRFPEDTSVQKIILPISRATAAYSHKDFAKVVDLLQPLAQYELGNVDQMLSTFLRGVAYLHMDKPTEAAAEFQRILDHSATVGPSPINALAELNLARAKTQLGDKAGARTAYQDLFAMWKDADADLPPLLAAKSEYAKLQ
jgi:tetratricopeptide (TPR) repeat protein